MQICSFLFPPEEKEKIKNEPDISLIKYFGGLRFGGLWSRFGVTTFVAELLGLETCCMLRDLDLRKCHSVFCLRHTGNHFLPFFPIKRVGFSLLAFSPFLIDQSDLTFTNHFTRAVFEIKLVILLIKEQNFGDESPFLTDCLCSFTALVSASRGYPSLYMLSVIRWLNIQVNHFTRVRTWTCVSRLLGYMLHRLRELAHLFIWKMRYGTAQSDLPYYD